MKRQWPGKSKRELVKFRYANHGGAYRKKKHHLGAFGFVQQDVLEFQVPMADLVLLVPPIKTRNGAIKTALELDGFLRHTKTCRSNPFPTLSEPPCNGK